MPMQKVLIAAVAISAFYYFKLYDNGKTIEDRITQLQTDLQTETTNKEATEAALQEVERMRKSVGDLGNQYQELVRQLPADLSSLEINRSIDEFSRDAGINIISRRPDNGKKNEIYLEEAVTIEAEGEYSKIAQFIYFVSRAERLMSMKSFVMRKSTEEEESSSILKFQGTIVNYKLAPEPPKGSEKKIEEEEGA